jgi:hypothetical protein
VVRTLGVALGGQLSATFIVDHQAHGLPTVTGFNETFVMAAAFLVVCMLAGLLIPARREEAPAPLTLDAQLVSNPEIV